MSLESIATILTFVGILLALVALRQTHRQSAEDEAARLRSALRSYKTSFSETVSLLREGSALIDPVWRATDALGELTEGKFEREEALELIEDKDMRLGIAVQAWSSSPISGEVRASLRDLNAAGTPVTGLLAFFKPASDIVDGIVKREDFPPLFFMNLLDSEILDHSLRKVESSGLSGQAARMEVGTFLQGQASAYFVTRYESALSQLDTFIKIATDGLAELDSRTINRLARSKRSRHLTKTTLTGQMEADLAEVATCFSAGEATALDGMLTEIASSLSKEGAERRIGEVATS